MDFFKRILRKNETQGVALSGTGDIPSKAGIVSSSQGAGPPTRRGLMEYFKCCMGKNEIQENQVAIAADAPNIVPFPLEDDTGTSQAKDLEQVKLLLEDIDKALGVVPTPLDDTGATAKVMNCVDKAETVLNQVGQKFDYLNPTPLSQVAAESSELFVDMLDGLGNLHWMIAGFSLVACIVRRVMQVQVNNEECLKLLISMRDLGTHIVQLLPVLEENCHSLQQAIQILMGGVVLCRDYCACGAMNRFGFATTNSENFNNFQIGIQKLYPQLTLATTSAVLKELTTPQPSLELELPSNTVGLEKRVIAVLEILGVRDLKAISTDDEVRVVVLHGMGGIGKTTLAAAIYNTLSASMGHSTVEIGENPNKAHICECQKNILGDVIGRKIDVGLDPSRGREQLKKHLREWKTPVCLFLDNIFEGRDLKELLPRDLVFPRGSKIILTTRSAHETIQEFMSPHHMGTPCSLYRVEELGRTEAKMLFLEHIGKPYDPRLNSEHLINDFLDICGGLPLALEVVGKYLGEHKEYFPELWKEALRDLGEYTPLGGEKTDILMGSLRFSYDKLNPKCQETFLDIACLMRDHPWEFLESSFGISHMLALQKFGLIKKVERSYLSLSGNTKFTILQIHDLFISLAKAENKSCDIRVKLKGEHEFQEWMQQRKQTPNPPPIGGLSLWGCNIEATELGALLASPSLRILDLGSLGIKGKSSQYPPPTLKILNLTYTTPFHDMGKLTELQTCELVGFPGELTMCSLPTHNEERMIVIRSLPPNLKRLGIRGGQFKDPAPTLPGRHLEELYFRDCPGLEKLPESREELENLRILEIRSAEWEVDVPQMEVLPKSWGLRQLPKTLKRIRIEGENLRKLCDSVPQGSALESLDLSGCQSLEALPNDFDNLVNLQRLNLQGCARVRELPPGLGKLHGLKELNLGNCTQLTSIDCCSNMTSLTSLDVRGCTKLSQMPEDFGKFVNLQHLIFRGCSDLGQLPNGVESLRELKELDLGGCIRLSPMVSCSNLPSLTSLHIGGCMGLSQLPTGLHLHLSSLQELDLQGCRDLSNLPSDFWKMTSLQILDLTNCINLVALPENFDQMTSLQTLRMGNCVQFTTLPGEVAKLSSLEHLNLTGCSGLTSIGDNFDNMSSLRELILNGCSELSQLTEDLTKLKSIKILDLTDCGNLTSLPVNFGGLTSLEKLELVSCIKLEALPDDFCNLRSLEYLILTDCLKLSSLPEGLSKLSSLHYLFLLGCVMLSQLPEDFGECRSLCILLLNGCSSLSKLPEGILNLKQLSHLGVIDCEFENWELLEELRTEMPGLSIQGMPEPDEVSEERKVKG